MTIDWKKFHTETKTKKSVSPASVEPPSYTNKPEDILSAWGVLEALSPPKAFKTPAKLAQDQSNATLVNFDSKEKFPWEEDIPKDKNVYYEVYLGTLDAKNTTKKLHNIYGEKEPVESKLPKGSYPFAILLVDECGQLASIQTQSLFLPSYAWAYQHTVWGYGESLSEWRTAENLIQGAFSKLYERINPEHTPLTRDLLDELYACLKDNIGLHDDIITPPYFALKKPLLEKTKVDKITKVKTPYYVMPFEPPLLNSFFLGDLSLAKSMIEQNKLPKNLQHYLGQDCPPFIDILKPPRNTLTKHLRASCFPPGCWVSKEHFRLSLLQQFAVNTIHKERENLGIFSVNGPPGTGKTTLLRDIISAVIVDRAKVMARYDDPSTAFKHQGKNERLTFYGLDSSFFGYEIIVASNNNKAVENITLELPSQASVDTVMMPAYFKGTANALYKNPDNWGLISARLGNSANIKDYFDTVLYDKKAGLSAYFYGIYKNDMDKKGIQAQKNILAEQVAPENEEQALKNWQEERKKFKALLQKYETIIADITTYEKATDERKPLEQKIETLKAEIETTQQDVLYQKERSLEYEKCLAERKEQKKEFDDEIKNHKGKRPSLWVRLFKRASTFEWKEQDYNLRHQRSTLFDEEQALRETLKTCTYDLNKAEQHCKSLQRQYKEVCLRCEEVKGTILKLSSYMKSPITQEFWQQDETVIQRTMPTLEEQDHKIREKIFIAAIELHKAFIDVNAKHIRNNLVCCQKILKGEAILGDKKHLVRDLWATLCLVTPVISTSLASVSKMFAQVEPESLGWLLIDEAGQATPQSVVGAILRSKNIVVVGDPLQVVPIENVDDTLSQSIFKTFGVDSARYAGPQASCQTLADQACRYGTILKSNENSSQRIGSPLLVHRRCLDPMFSISNDIAYNKMMVHGRDDISPKNHGATSAWCNVEGTCNNKWVEEEGKKAIAIIESLRQKEGHFPDVFIISPFRNVVYPMRSLFQETYKSEATFTKEELREWCKNRIGTVHTFQGKEANTVIVLLGANDEQSQPARQWVTSTPNLINVAVTRAKRQLYIIGSLKAWGNEGLMAKVTHALLPHKK